MGKIRQTVGSVVESLQHMMFVIYGRISAAPVRDRGDVPGWVLVTVMTAGLVTALWVVADDQLSALFDRAVNSVTGP